MTSPNSNTAAVTSHIVIEKLDALEEPSTTTTNTTMPKSPAAFSNLHHVHPIEENDISAEKEQQQNSMINSISSNKPESQNNVVTINSSSHPAVMDTGKLEISDVGGGERDPLAKTNNTIALNNLERGNNTGLSDSIIIKRMNESNFKVALKLLAIFSTLYFFMCSSSLLSEAFKLTSVHHTGQLSPILENPIMGLMVGIITTIIVQSSGAVTSVLVTMVGSGVIGVKEGIPIIMGANVGTSVTNTIVSLIEYGDKKNFGIAITAGIVHDMYNILSVVFLLPFELLTGFLEKSSLWLLELIGTNKNRPDVGELQFLSFLVQPVVKWIVYIDEYKLHSVNPNTPLNSTESIIKRCCDTNSTTNYTIDNISDCKDRCK